MHRMAAGLPLGWQIDLEDLGNEHGKPKIQPCNACVSSSIALCVWPCNCYGPHSDHQPDLLWDLDLYARLARADAVGVYRADQLVRTHLELQAAVRSSCLHERRQSSTGFDRQEEHGFGASSSVPPNGKNCPRAIWRAVQPPSFVMAIAARPIWTPPGDQRY
jgi:hypothetical protein